VVQGDVDLMAALHVAVEVRARLEGAVAHGALERIHRRMRRRHVPLQIALVLEGLQIQSPSASVVLLARFG